MLYLIAAQIGFASKIKVFVVRLPQGWMCMAATTRQSVAMETVKSLKEMRSLTTVRMLENHSGSVLSIVPYSTQTFPNKFASYHARR